MSTLDQPFLKLWPMSPCVDSSISCVDTFISDSNLCPLSSCVDYSKPSVDTFIYRSTWVPRGMVEDILVLVDNFYFLANFIILDTQHVANPSIQIPIILGLLFLAVSNTFIQCKNGVMRLDFGSMTYELNIFNVAK